MIVDGAGQTTSLFRPGHFVWADLLTPDLAASVAFYGGLFSWKADTAAPEDGGHTKFVRDGLQVAGAITTTSASMWSPYIGTDDVDAVVANVPAARGTVVKPPFDCMAAGRAAVVSDPSGAAFSLWQPARHHGFQASGVAGAVAFVELRTPDPAAIAPFYRTLFGWRLEPVGNATGTVNWQLNGSVARLGPSTAARASWIVDFAVGDLAQAIRLAISARAKLVALEERAGAGALLVDPLGAVFGLVPVGG